MEEEGLVFPRCNLLDIPGTDLCAFTLVEYPFNWTIGAVLVVSLKTKALDLGLGLREARVRGTPRQIKNRRNKVEFFIFECVKRVGLDGWIDTDLVTRRIYNLLSSPGLGYKTLNLLLGPSIGLVLRCISYSLFIVSTCLPDVPLLASLTEITSESCHSRFKHDPNQIPFIDLSSGSEQLRVRMLPLRLVVNRLDGSCTVFWLSSRYQSSNLSLLSNELCAVSIIGT